MFGEKLRSKITINVFTKDVSFAEGPSAHYDGLGSIRCRAWKGLVSPRRKTELYTFSHFFRFFFFCFFFHFYSKLIFSRLIVNLSYNWMENLSKKGNICAKRMFSTFRSSKSQSQVPWKGSSIGVSRVTRRRQLSPNAVRWVVAQRLCPTRQPRIRLMSGKEGHP